MSQKKILIIGAGGQLGTVLTKELQDRYGEKSVVNSDIRKLDNVSGVFEILDATNFKALEVLVEKHKITEIYHLAAILSANGEKNPLNTWDINMSSLFNVFEVARIHSINKVFYPSSIAVFGGNIDRENTQQNSNLTPSTVYGMSKVAGENWANYYSKKYNIDIRSLRFPGVIGYQSMPGGGTTDYAVDIFHKAVNDEEFECFLNSQTKLPMIFMDDVIRATLELMETPKNKIKIRTSYNLSGLSFTPEELFLSIKKILPNFKINYKPDFRQEIADSWPKNIDDFNAKKDWNWKPKFDLDKITQIMISELQKKYSLKKLQCTAK